MTCGHTHLLRGQCKHPHGHKGPHSWQKVSKYSQAVKVNSQGLASVDIGILLRQQKVIDTIAALRILTTKRT